MIKRKLCAGWTVILLIFLAVTLPASAAVYTYDDLGRLTSVTFESGQKLTYNYDAGGNMLGPDNNGPTVSSTYPANGANGVAVNKPITVTFSELVKPGISFHDIALKAGSTVTTATYSINGNTLTITPAGNLDFKTAYTVYIPAGAIKDTAENNLTNNYTFSFTTQALLTTTDDFGSDSGLWTYSGSAAWDNVNGYAVLTSNNSGQAGNIWFNKDILSSFIVEFRYKAGGGSGADGLTFMFYKNKNYNPGSGGALGFNDNFGRDVPGYGIEFDNWGSGADPSWNHIALIKDSVGNHLQWVNDPRTEDNTWHTVKVAVDDQSIVVNVDNNKIIDWQGTIDKKYAGFGFSAATGGFTNWHIIDDIKISVPDTPAASLSVSSADPPDGAVDVPVDKTVSVTFSEDVQPGDDFDGITLKNGNTVAAYTYSINGNKLTLTPAAKLAYSTNYTVTVPANAVKGAAGNPLAGQHVFSFTTQAEPDTIPPSGSLTINNGAAFTNSTSVSLNFTATDNSGDVPWMRFSDDGTTWSDWETYATAKNWSLTTGDSTKTVYVQFKDAAGNVSGSYSDTIVLDTTPPAVSIAAPSSGIANDNTPVLTYTVSDGNVIVEVDGIAVNKVSGDSFDTLADGSHTVTVKSTDLAGNTGFDEITFTVDTVPPEISLTPIKDKYFYGDKVAVEFSAVDGGSGVASVTAALKGQPIENEAVIDINELGTQELVITAQDKAGNISVKKSVFEVILQAALIIKPNPVEMDDEQDDRQAKDKKDKIDKDDKIDEDEVNDNDDDREWVKAYIEFPSGFDVASIDISSIRLNGTITAAVKWDDDKDTDEDDKKKLKLKDKDHNGIPELEVRFDKAEVIKLLTFDQLVEVTITGVFGGQYKFEGFTLVKLTRDND